MEFDGLFGRSLKGPLIQPQLVGGRSKEFPQQSRNASALPRPTGTVQEEMREGGWIPRERRQTIAHILVVVQLGQFSGSVFIYPEHDARWLLYVTIRYEMVASRCRSGSWRQKPQFYNSITFQ